MLDIIDTPFSYGRVFDRLLISLGIFQAKRKYSTCDLKSTNRVFTKFVGQIELTIAALLHSATFNSEKRI